MRKVMIAASMLLIAGSVGAQTPAHDPSSRLSELLPPEASARVMQVIADARARQLPAQAIEHRALEMLTKGATPAEVLDRVSKYAGELSEARSALQRGGVSRPSDDEVAGAAEVISKGVSGEAVAEFARNSDGAPLAVALFVVGSLLDAEHPANKALAEVQKRLEAGASEGELRAIGEAAAASRKPAATGRELADTKRPANAGRPAGVPANPGTVPVSVPTPPTGRP